MCASWVGLCQQALHDRVIRKIGGETFPLHDCLINFVNDAPPPGTVAPMDGCNACNHSIVDLVTTECVPEADIDMSSAYNTGGAEMDGELQKDYEADPDEDDNNVRALSATSASSTNGLSANASSTNASTSKKRSNVHTGHGSAKKRRNGRKTKRRRKELELAARFLHQSKQDHVLDSFDGALAVQDLLLPSLINRTWCHAIGYQENGERALPHAGIPLSVGATITRKEHESAIKFRSAEEGPTIKKAEHAFKDCDGLSRVVKVQWMHCEQVKNLPPIVKGAGPTKAFVLKTTPVDLPLDDDDVDVACVTMGPVTANGEAHLVAACYKPSSGVFPDDFDFASVGDELLTSLLPRAGVRGLEASRSGGALGRCDPKSEDFEAFMKRRGKIPRVGKAAVVVVINSPSRCGVLFSCYQETKEKGKRVVSCWHNTPRAGGNQTLLDRHVREHRVLQKFPWCRVVSAILCIQLNKLNLFRRPVVPTASRNLLFLCSLACQKAEAHADDPVLGDPLHWMAKESKHTLVMHPVGWHFDIFADNGKDCIENKLCLVSWDRTDFSRTDLPLGRGGLGPGSFVFGLLDWNGPARRRRQVYIDNGGDAGQRVTQQRMETFMASLEPAVAERLTQEAAVDRIDLVAGCIRQHPRRPRNI
jgi:hypothetical protein